MVECLYVVEQPAHEVRADKRDHCEYTGDDEILMGRDVKAKGWQDHHVGEEGYAEPYGDVGPGFYGRT